MVDSNLFWITDSLEKFALSIQVSGPEPQASLASR